MDKETQEKKELRGAVNEWLRSIGYSATSREINKLVTKLLKLGDRKLPDKTPFSLGSGGDVRP